MNSFLVNPIDIQEVSPYNDIVMFHRTLYLRGYMSHRVQTETQVHLISYYKLNRKPFIMFFQSEACGVCHAIQPRINDMLENYDVKYVTIDAAKYPSIAGQHQVFTVPTIIIWAENREILRESRFVNFSKIERALEFMQIYETTNEGLSYRNN